MNIPILREDGRVLVLDCFAWGACVSQPGGQGSANMPLTEMLPPGYSLSDSHLYLNGF